MNKIVNRTCRNQSVFEVIDELKSDGLIPQNSTLGNRVTDSNKPENAVACITTRPNEMFWVVADA